MASYALSLSDEDLPGATSLAGLTLNLTGTVAPAAVFTADFDDDDDVDGNDFLGWQLGVGTLEGGARAQGDANGDGTIDADDLGIWKSRFGQPESITQVPEPGACLLSFLALTALARRRCT